MWLLRAPRAVRTKKESHFSSDFCNYFCINSSSIFVTKILVQYDCRYLGTGVHFMPVQTGVQRFTGRVYFHRRHGIHTHRCTAAPTCPAPACPQCRGACRVAARVGESLAPFVRGLRPNLRAQAQANGRTARPPCAPLASTPRVTRPPSAQFADIRRYQELVQGGGSFYKISESAPPPRALCRLWS